LPNLDDVLVRRADVLARETSEGAVLVDVVTGGCWELNRVGSALWSLLESPTSLRSVCDALRTRYDVAAGVIERDVLVLAAELSKAGLVSHPARSVTDTG
jgi:hypothetical protein